MKWFFEHVPDVPDHALTFIVIGLLFGVPILLGIINDRRRSPLKKKENNR